ncbi:conserved hypothetical protein [metagenome]|uniref:Glyoxalase-like domain-containing protein n=1 Tax=metagenome TaxID=256318 RepID=A0A2P2CKN6_9ZZZZ
MAARLQSLTVLSPDPERLASFWGELLGSSGEDELPFALVVEPGHVPRVALNQIHFHLSSNAASQEDTVARAIELGATHLDVGQLPAEDHVVLADPDGNEFCVIEAGNSWMAGTGFLGEVAADGTREVGIFWSAALDWPLVHDEDGETAIAPPDGGIKIAWGGPPLNPQHDRNRMHFVLGTDDLEAEVERLVGLGATVVERGHGDVEMADPDGNEFRLRG